MVGVLMNTVPIRITVSPETPLLTWLKQIREQWIALREYEHTPIDKIWEWSGLPPGMPPYDNLLIYENRAFADTMRRLGGTWQHRSITRTQRTDSPLTLVAHGRPRMTLEIVYNQSLFGRDLISGMTGHLHAIFQSFLAHPESQLANLTMLAESDERLLQEVNQTQIDYPRDICVHRLFEQQAARIPDRLAFDSPSGAVTYREVNQRANRLASFLRAKGAGAEDFVAVCMQRSPEAVLAVLGIVKTGAAFLPLDPRLPEARLLPMLHDARPKFVLADDASFPKLSSYGAAVLNLSELPSTLALQPDENLPDIAAPHNAAYAIYTSGSTGTPKAVVITHASLVNYVLAAGRVYEISDADRRLQFSWMGADFFVAEVFNNLSAGATLVFCLDQQGNSVTEFLRLLDQHHITITGMPSSWWHEWVRSFSKSGFTPPQSLRVVVTGMEQVNPAALQTWNRVVGARIRWFNAYGPTETTCTSTIYEAGSSDWESAQYVPIGKPVANTQLYVLDRRRNPVPTGVPGELYIAGAGVGRGYLNSAELTAQRFLPDPFSAGASANRMYRTGDQVFFLPDGNLVFLGRLDRQVKIRGFRVELDEIEAVITNHPSVRECAVVVHDDRLIAYVSSTNDAVPEIQLLRRHASAHLATHMLPAAFVVLPKMPLTLSGKIDRQSLPPFDPELLGADQEFKEASTPTEKLLVALWQQALGVVVTDATANFFELGGDSLRAAQLILLIQQQFGREFPFATLLRAPTIQRVAAILDSGESESADTAAGWDAVFPLQIQGSLPPFFCLSPTLQGPYCYRHLSKHLGTSQPFYVVRVLPKEGERVPTIEELAGRAIHSIRATKPHGPYILAGYCFGGSIAFEAARQLNSMGEAVQMIVLFDTAAPGYPKVVREHRRNWRQLRDVFVGSSDNRIGVREIISHLDTTGRMIKRKVLGKTERQIARYQLAVLAPPVETVEKWQLRSACMYEVKPTHIPVAQFLAQDQAISTRILEDPRLAWRELSTGDFHLHWVSGSHGTLLGENEAPEVARLIGGLLENARPKKMSGAAG
jgi:amino acid adenylation domain-containing protein